jgi:hypothetical protein
MIGKVIRDQTCLAIIMRSLAQNDLECNFTSLGKKATHFHSSKYIEECS